MFQQLKNITTLTTHLPTALLLLCVTLAGFGCMADVEERKGHLGEFCSTDVECQGESICDSITAQCVEDNSAQAVACRTLCERRSNECNAVETCNNSSNFDCCKKRCRTTIANWKESVLEPFAACFERLECEEAAKESSANTCLTSLPLDEARADVCLRLRDRARALENSEETARDLLAECRVLARTGKDIDWEANIACDDSDLDGDEFKACITAVYKDNLNPPLN